jgi:hypothetical protein
MRFVALLTLVLLVCGVREAWATCGGCCESTAELLGWSTDGRTFVIRHKMDGGSPQIVVYRDDKEIERWGGNAGDECLSDGVKPAMPKDTFARHKIVPLEAAWRDAFRADFRIVKGAKPVRVDQATCTSWDVTDAGGKLATRVVRQCDPNETACIRGDVLGGYAHPSKAWLLVKTRTHSCGFSSSTRYQLVRLDS